MMPADPVNTNDLAMNVRFVVRATFTRWRFLVFCMLLFSVFGFLRVSLFKPYYSSKLTFFLDDNNKALNLFGFASLAQQMNLTEAAHFQGERSLLMELLKSKEIYSRTFLKKVHIGGKSELLINAFLDRYELPNYLIEDYQADDYRFQGDFSVHNDLLGMRILSYAYHFLEKDHIKIKDKVGGIVEITFKSEFEEFAYLFVNQMFESLLEFYEKDRLRKLRETYDYLQNQHDSLLNAIMQAENRMAGLKDAGHGLIRYSARLDESLLIRELAVLNELLIENTKALEISRMQKHRDASVIRIIDMPFLPLEYTELSYLVWIIIGAVAGAFFALFISFLLALYHLSTLMEKNKLSGGYGQNKP
jgi:hypothetical protein